MHKIFYHQYQSNQSHFVDCPDDVAAAWVVHRHLLSKGIDPATILVVGCDYQSDPPDVRPGDSLYIVDFSFPPVTLFAIAEMVENLVICDHHKTAMETLATNNFSQAIIAQVAGSTKIWFDMTESGATLAWKNFNLDQPIPLFLQYVRDRDIWTKTMPETDIVFEGMSAIRHRCQSKDEVFTLFDRWSQDDQRFLAEVLETGRPLIEEKLRQCEELAATAQITQFQFPNGEVYSVPVIEVPEGKKRLVSDTGSLLYRRHPEYLFVLFVSRQEDCVKYELRSDGRFDVGALAKACGGGGHVGAAGFKAFPSSMTENLTKEY